MFPQFNLHKDLNASITKKGYSTPTEIQEKCIPHLLAKKNLIGIAATGTGKTGAFLIPIVQQMLEKDALTSLVIVPTRELALQVNNEFRSFTKSLFVARLGCVLSLSAFPSRIPLFSSVSTLLRTLDMSERIQSNGKAK